MQNYILDYSKSGKQPNIRELTLLNGISYPDDEELIMLILGKGTKNNPIESLAEKVTKTINSSNEEELIPNLKKINGMGESRALIIAAALELGRRRRGILRSSINAPKDVIPFLQHYTLMPTEHFITVTVNGAKEILSTRVVSVGTINKALIHPREVFANAVSEYASGIICCHNHPCGQCYPSNADIDSTKILQKAAKILGIVFMDHIIITKEDYFSFLEHGML
ncbi:MULTISPECIES: JAB domain-containing protein [Treponema]|uniref:DNA repair protein RadC n=1 Tax=Treponema succinifaciens (strain ATCC 33096 / DSM 2489 / 6091) TaxID=869209 RepID=F2NW47_TRES6|nr:MULTISPECIES: DNA repair protein RadC [Treponema]AEB14902.1 DNA repair protein RadC [Treponema succinifaciens DSM 2489]MCI6913582.1 DNA repair protein RadC [Treponema succinifaciens]MDY2615407.1 DNA repair protein RadC [Treponema succinifaciens]UKI55188.1 MAG: DNA repair protein RadC [Treponema succinifaciens]